jgi:hypothetical protein
LPKVDLPPFVNDFHPKMDLVLDKETFIYVWHIHYIFHLVVFWLWCMSFCKIVLSLMTLLVTLIFFWNMWAYSLWLCSSIDIMLACCIATNGCGRNKLKVFGPSWLNRWFIDDHLHTSYSIQEYICKTFYSTLIWGGNVRRVWNNGSWG